MRALALENANLEASIQVAEESKAILDGHYQQLVEVNDKLNRVVPQYEAQVETLTEALQQRTDYGDCEHKVKVMYATLLGTLSEMMEHHGKDQELTDEILEMVLDCNEEHAVDEHAIAGIAED